MNGEVKTWTAPSRKRCIHVTHELSPFIASTISTLRGVARSGAHIQQSLQQVAALAGGVVEKKQPPQSSHIWKVCRWGLVTLTFHEWKLGTAFKVALQQGKMKPGGIEETDGMSTVAVVSKSSANTQRKCRHVA